MNLDEWARTWAIGPAAMKDLRDRMCMTGLIATAHPKRPDEGASESRVESLLRLEASQENVLLWRNNVGALLDERGVPVRYGLANESKAMNKAIKSSDYIGLRPVLITPAHVGHTIGQFVARETKHGTWKYTGDEHERAQKVFIDLVLANGGDASFATGVGTLRAP